MFTDIHNHILPNLDDGSENWEMSREMFKIAVSENISSIITTPHYIQGYVTYNKEEFIKTLEDANQYLNHEGLPLTLYPGNEIFLDAGNVESLIRGESFTLNEGSYVLIELPNYIKNDVLEDIVYELQLQQYKVIFAHVERFQYFYENPNVLDDYLDIGVIMQGNVNSLFTKERRRKKFILKLIKSRKIQVLATDAHNNEQRAPKMKRAYNFIKKQFSEDLANDLFVVNPRKVLRNQTIEIVKQKKLKGLNRFKWGVDVGE